MLFIGWALLSIAVAIAAASRGRSIGNWFAISLVLSPLLGLLLLLAFPPLKVATATDARWQRAFGGPQASVGTDVKIVIGVLIAIAAFIGLLSTLPSILP
jgi:hypothetical protein